MDRWDYNRKRQRKAVVRSVVKTRELYYVTLELECGHSIQRGGFTVPKTATCPICTRAAATPTADAEGREA